MSGAIGGRYVNPIQQVVDAQGIPMVGAKLYFFATGTGTFQNTYADPFLTVPNSNPVVTNAMGMRPQIFCVPSPAYRVRLEDATGTIIWDCDPVSSLPTTGFGGSIPGYTPVGSIMPYAAATPPSHWLFCDGSAISRTVFSTLFAVIGTRFGAGDGAVTFNVPDLRGSVVVGLDNQGGVAAGRVTYGNSGIDGATIGARGGSELVQAHNHSYTEDSHTHTLTDPGHHHVQYYTGSFPGHGLPEGGVSNAVGPGTPSPDLITANSTTNITIGAATGGGTLSSFGGGNSQNMPPSIVTLYIIFAG